MPNVIRFRSPTRPPRQAVDAAFLDRSGAHSHAVQPYESEELLVDMVGQFLRAGLKRGERVLVIAHPERAKAFVAELEADAQIDVARAIASGCLVCLDANAMLDRFMVDGMPDAERFHVAIGRALADLAGDAATAPPIRAYGEMIDLLWREGSFTAAIALEELWNEARKRHSFELLCAYLMGHFYKEQHGAHLEEVRSVHSHVLTPERR